MDANLHRTILDNLFDGVYYVDRNRIVTFWNKAAERLTGYSQDEVLGFACSDNILRHIDANGCELCLDGCPLHDTIHDGHMREALLFLHHKQGHRVPVHIRTSPLFDSNGNIVGGIEIFSDNSQPLLMLKDIEQLRKDAYLDPLLQIGNRRYAEMVFKARLYELNAFVVPFGAIFLDIDNFKKINDSLGHVAGDDALRMVCRSIGNGLRQLDALIRWGGDEFLVLLPNITKESLRTTAERIRVFVEKSFIMVDSQKSIVTLSIGATLAEKNDTLETLVERADALLYQSKEGGRNRLTIG